MSRTGGLVNNAGVTWPVGPFAEARTEDLRRVLDVNVLGVMKGCRRAARDMTRAGAGAIVNASSGAATLGSPGQYVHYAASKAAMEVQSECLTTPSRVGGRLAEGWPRRHQGVVAGIRGFGPVGPEQIERTHHFDRAVCAMAGRCAAGR